MTRRTDPERKLWCVQVAFLATPAHHEALLDQLTDVLCSDPNHNGPCDTPWALHSVEGDSLPAKKREALLREIEDTNSPSHPA
jgi:hypothetical protein